MKNFVKFFVFALVILSGGCSSEKNDLAIKAYFEKTYVIEAEASSCYAKRAASSDAAPVTDITSSYFQIQKFGFYWPFDNRAFIISSLRLKFMNPNFDGGVYKCNFAGDRLLALNSNWWKHGEAVVGGGIRDSIYLAGTQWTPTQLMQIDCSMYCGGLPSEVGYTATGTVEVIGFHVESNGELTPNSAQTTITIENMVY